MRGPMHFGDLGDLVLTTIKLMVRMAVEILGKG